MKLRDKKTGAIVHAEKSTGTLTWHGDLFGVAAGQYILFDENKKELSYAFSEKDLFNLYEKVAEKKVKEFNESEL